MITLDNFNTQPGMAALRAHDLEYGQWANSQEVLAEYETVSDLFDNIVTPDKLPIGLWLWKTHRAFLSRPIRAKLVWLLVSVRPALSHALIDDTMISSELSIVENVRGGKWL